MALTDEFHSGAQALQKYKKQFVQSITDASSKDINYLASIKHFLHPKNRSQRNDFYSYNFHFFLFLTIRGNAKPGRYLYSYFHSLVTHFSF